MMMFETSKHVPKTEKRCCVFKVKRSNYFDRPGRVFKYYDTFCDHAYVLKCINNE